MAAYRADIEIAVKGGRQLAEVSERIGQLGKQINDVNKTAKLQGAIPASVNNYRSAVEQANAAVRASAAGTTTQKRAIDLYVKSLAQAEKAELNLAAAIKKRQRELNITTTAPGARGGQSRFAGAASNAIIGGAFPLLFGQGAGAATGGAIGGAVGGLFGGTGGFAGSLLGTLVGDLASRANQVKELGTDIGFSAQQTQQLADAFKQAGTDFDKFQDSVQNIRGLGLSIEEQANAIKLVSTLTDTYGGKIDKVTNAFTSALESGKVTQATLNQLTSQGIPIQDELAKKYGVSRDSLLQMAKDGEISVQSLADTLVDMGNKGLEAGEKPRTAFENFTSALGNTGTAIANVANTLLNVLSPAIDTIINQATQALNIITETVNTELLRTKIQSQSGKILSPAKLREIEATAGSMAATRYPSEAKGRQLAAGSRILSPRAQAEFQVLREQMIRNELKSFGYESGILTTPKSTVSTQIGRISAPSQAAPSGGGGSTKAPKERESRLPELQIELELAQKIAALNLRIAEAKDKGNRTTEYALEMDKILEERSTAIAKINLQDIPVAEKNLQTQIATVQANEKINQIIIERNRISKEAISTAEKVLADSQKEIGTLQVKRDRQAEYAKLIKEGVLPANAENYLQTKELVKEALKSAEAAIVEAEARGASADEVDRLRKNLESIRGAGQTEIDKAKAPDKGATITDAITEARGELNELLDKEKQVVAAAQAIGDAFSQAFKGLVSGAMTGQQALAAFFKGVGDHFLDMASKMIAKLIEIYILETVLGFITGGISGAAGNTDPGGKAIASGSSIHTAAKGAYWPGGFQAFADGGMVTKPTMGLIGEGGEPEYVIPASKMRGAMARYAAGARGSAVIPGNGTSGGGGAMGSGSGAIDVRYTVERINSVDYVTADQFQKGMAQAARQGAEQGERRALGRLRNSPATRNRVGV